MHTPLERVQAIELLTGARHADIAEPPLFFNVIILIARLRMRQDAFLHAREEDNFEFQPLRRVERHQRDALLRFVAIEVGHQRE